MGTVGTVRNGYFGYCRTELPGTAGYCRVLHDVNIKRNNTLINVLQHKC
jgi:hypothetical protein